MHLKFKSSQQNLLKQMPQKSIWVMVFVNFTGCSLFDKYLTFLLTYLNIAWELLSTTLKWSKSLGKNSNRKTKRKSSTEAKSSDLFPSFRLILNSDRFKEPLISLHLALWMAPLLISDFYQFPDSWQLWIRVLKQWYK